VFMKLKGAK